MALARSARRARGSARAARRRTRVVVLVGGREVGPEPGQLDALVGRGGVRRARTTAAGSRSPSRPMPVSYLTWTCGRTPSSRRRARDQRRGSRRARPRARPGAERDVELGAASARPCTKIGRARRARSRSSTASVAVATASQVAPPRERRVGALDRAVAVAVGLDDGAERRARRELAGEPGAVALDRAGVDHRRGAAGTDRARLSGSGPPGSPRSRRSRSPTRRRRPARRRSRPARVCAWTRGAGGRRTARARGRSARRSCR